MKNQIVIITQKNDPHADDVILVLNTIGQQCVRLNSDDIPLNTNLSLEISNNSTDWKAKITNNINNLTIDFDDVRSIWWRKPDKYLLPTSLSHQEREFAKIEIDSVLSGLWASTDAYWVSHPDNIRLANLKVTQLKRAIEVGFDVPRTLITTHPDEAREFYESCKGQMIFKVISDPFLAMDKIDHTNFGEDLTVQATYTTLITNLEIAHINSVKTVPCLFQEYIPKQAELRVTIIGDDIFAAEITPKTDKHAVVDWRHPDADVVYKKILLPPEVVERCFALVRSYGLNFSALDLILTPDGQYVFIENNPNGQFIFIEMLVPELKMIESLVSCLIRGANS